MDDMQGFNTDMLKIYYAKLFPFDEFYQWLSYGNDKALPDGDLGFMSRREFSFTLENDIYVRYQSFKDESEMEKSIKEKCPHKIDIGPVYNVDPAKRNAYQGVGSEKLFVPVERELVFDVDITDYDDVRTCCSGADVCLNCWPLMTCAIKVIHQSLLDDFGFSHILWVYSGRRGVHCWVCDDRARKLTNEQRSAIAEYYHVYKGSENNNHKVNLFGSVHPFLTKAFNRVLKLSFEESILPLQKLFVNKESAERLVSLIPDAEVSSGIVSAWEADKKKWPSNDELNMWRWKVFQTKITSGARKNPSLRRCLEEIIFTYTYPRIDLEVSKHMNHLLKAPFCVHPKTGKVCVPIDPDHCEGFDPDGVPTLSSLLNGLNSTPSGAEAGMEEGPSNGSLEAAVSLFRSSFLSPLLQSMRSERLERLKSGTRSAGSTLAW